MDTKIKHQYEVHPAATLFPPMTEDEYQGLKKDIAENGQREDIVVWCDRLIDGRHRLRACEELQRNPHVSELDPDTDPWKYVISQNLHRRHLTESQRGMVAAELAKLKRGAPVGNDNAVKNGEKTKGPIGTIKSSIAEASKKLKVGERTTKRAKNVIKNGCKELQQLVKDGKLSVSKAEEIANGVKCPKEQMAIAKEFIETPKVGSKKKESKPIDIGKIVMTSLRDAENAIDLVDSSLDLRWKVPDQVAQKIHAIGGKIISVLKKLEAVTK